MTQDSAPATGASTPVEPAEPRGWRHGATWLYLVMLVASAAALLVSFILSAETLQMARNPDQALSCDVNAKLSCTTVAQSWQSEIVKFGEMSFPNAVIGLARMRMPAWFATCTWLGGVAALAYSYWLTSQSLFVINALCPWCLVLCFATTLQFMALSHATVTVQGLPAYARGLRKYYRLGFDLMVDAVWIVALITLILVKDGAYLFTF